MANAGKRLTDFDAAGTPSNADVLYSSQGGAEKQMTVAQLAAFVSEQAFSTYFSSLPRSLPSTAGVLWNNNGVLSIS